MILNQITIVYQQILQEKNMKYSDVLNFCIKKVSLLVLLIIFIERVYEVIRKFVQYPTYFDIHFVPQYHASFPALTVCSLKGYKSKALQVN